jgi:cytochrome c-type biogenesis protein CcmH/NrfG
MLLLKKKPDPSPVEVRATLAGEPPAITNVASAAPAVSRTVESRYVYAMAVLALIVGLPMGYLLRGSDSPAGPPAASARQPSAAAGPMAGGQMPTLEQMKQAADKQAAPLLDKLKSDPNNAALLGQIGAVYDSMHQFTQGAVYYNRAVQADPGNAVFHNKLAISLYSNGDVDGAIAQLNQALAHDPGYADALFNLGMIKLQGKQDGKGALAAWRQLLKSNPQLSADRKAIVLKQIAGVEAMLNNQKAPDSKR